MANGKMGRDSGRLWKEMKEEIRNALLESGVAAIGFSKAGEIDPGAHNDFKSWIGEGCHGEMLYLERHADLRQKTDNVLPGASTVISLAFDYSPEVLRDSRLPVIAAYAYGEDYHIVLRERLYPVVEKLREGFGGKWRICIDSAPVAERYWAIKSGIGKRGLNGSVIVEGCEGFCFLVEILTTLSIEPDEVSKENQCQGCGKCIEICPGKALRGDGTVDAGKCINYLTIEKKGDFTAQEKELLKQGSGFLLGCDLCLRVCPHNREFLSKNPPKNFIENGKGNHEKNLSPRLFPPIPQVLNLDAESVLKMTESEFNSLFSRSPLGYAGYTKLRRNAGTLSSHRDISSKDFKSHD